MAFLTSRLRLTVTSIKFGSGPSSAGQPISKYRSATTCIFSLRRHAQAPLYRLDQCLRPIPCLAYEPYGQSHPRFSLQHRPQTAKHSRQALWGAAGSIPRYTTANDYTRTALRTLQWPKQASTKAPGCLALARCVFYRASCSSTHEDGGATLDYDLFPSGHSHTSGPTSSCN